jgi:hypothetical protein
MADSIEGIDDKELKEREEATDALAGEDEQHFVNYCIESARESRDSRKDVLQAMSLLWDAYQNMMDFGDKEEWQSRVVTNKPFAAVERAVAIIGRAFKNPNYLTTEGVQIDDKDQSEYVKKAMQFWAGHQKVNFPFKFKNASRMSMAIGLSLELIPRWENGMLLDWTEPWKILRDPDALPGEPWSGNYWIHEEWIDKWKLEEAAKDGYYINVDDVKEGGTETGQESTKEEIERRKKMFWERSSYRKSVLVREFNGVVLDKKGKLLLPNAKFTIAADKLIRKPSIVPFVNIRWPGSSFAPIPHILRYDGRGLIEGVFEIWKMLNKMLSLTMDDFSWVVNRMREIVPELMLDPTDLDMYPGKDIYRSTDHLDRPVVNDLLTQSSIDKILAVAQYMAQQIDNGDFVSEFVAGLPGSRSQITKGEVEIKTEQNMGIFDSIGTEIEGGAVNVAYAMYETMVLNWNKESLPSPVRVLGENPFTLFLEGASLDEKKQFLKENCDIRIVGISAQLQMAEKVKLLMALKQYAESPLFASYFKPKELLDETVGALGMYKAPFIKTVEELQQTQTGQQLVEILGKLASEGGPEVQARIQQFIASLSGGGGMAPEVGGGNGGGSPVEIPEAMPGSEISVPAEVPTV